MLMNGIWRGYFGLALSAALAISTRHTAQAGTIGITFPVGTPVTTIYSPSYYQYVDVAGFRFTRQLGGIWINASDLDGAHPEGGGLYVAMMGVETTMRMSRIDGRPFGLVGMSVLETNNPTGLVLTIGARPHSGMPSSIEAEFPFDLNRRTYDYFDVNAQDEGFENVDFVTFVSIDSPFVDPANANFVLDRITVVVVPEPASAWLLALGLTGGWLLVHRMRK